MRDRYIFKILTPGEWTDFQHKNVFKGSFVDLRDGYIHMSARPELLQTLEKWYGEVLQVFLLEVDSKTLGSGLKYEVSRGGAEFPHLFADLPIAAIGKVWLVSPDAGRYRLPHDLKANEAEPR